MNTLLFLAFLLMPAVNPPISISGTVCDVTGFYEPAYFETGAKVLTTSGELATVDVLLKPVKSDEGSYDIKITRKAPNLYLVVECSQPGKVVANKFYIEARNCNEFANYDKATLVVIGNFGVVKGKVSFK